MHRTLRAGRIAGIVDGAGATQQQIIALALGGKSQAAA